MASVDVKIENGSGQTVGIRLDEDSDALKRIKKKVKAEALESVKVTKSKAPAAKGSTKSKSPAKDEASTEEGDSSADGAGDDS